MYTIDEEDFEQIKDELTPLGMSGLYEDEDGNLVTVESSKSVATERKKQPHKKTLQEERSERANPAYWFQFYDPRYCSESCEEYCKKMAAKYT